MKHPLILAIVIAVASTACSGDDTADPTTTLSTTAPSTATEPSSVTSTTNTTATTEPSSTTASSTTSTATTTEPSPSTAPSTAVPTTDPTGEPDWRFVLETLGLRRQELYRDPDVTRIGEVCTDSGPCAEQLEVQLGDMASKGWHIEGGDPYTVLEAELEDFTGDSVETSQIVTVVAIVRRQADGGTIVDASGTVLAVVDPDTPEGFNPQARVTLARVGPAGDEWRIVDTTRIREVPA